MTAADGSSKTNKVKKTLFRPLKLTPLSKVRPIKKKTTIKIRIA